MSDRLLMDYERKWERAARHLSEITGSVRKFTATANDPVVGRFEAAQSRYVFDLPLDAITPEWSLLVGDFAYDTRASLDYLMTALIRRAGNEETETSQFPIRIMRDIGEWPEASDRWDHSRRVDEQLLGSPPGTKAALKVVQPFADVPLQNPFEHPLYALQTLNNRDKHRRLNLLARHASMTFQFRDQKPAFAGQPVKMRVSEHHEGNGLSVSLTVSRELGRELLVVPTYEVHLNELPYLIGEVIGTLDGIRRFIEDRVLPVVLGLLRP